MKCSLCAQEVLADQFTQHLSDYHVQEQCEHCGTTATGTLGLADHLEKCNVLKSPTGLPNISPATPTAPPSTPTAQDPQTSTLCPQDAPAPVCLTAQQTTPDVCLLSAPAPPQYLRHLQLRAAHHFSLPPLLPLLQQHSHSHCALQREAGLGFYQSHSSGSSSQVTRSGLPTSCMRRMGN